MARQLTPDQQKGLMLGVAGETVLAGAGFVAWYVTGEIVWIIAGVAAGSALLIFMLFRAGVFSPPNE